MQLQTHTHMQEPKQHHPIRIDPVQHRDALVLVAQQDIKRQTWLNLSLSQWKRAVRSSSRFQTQSDSGQYLSLSIFSTCLGRQCSCFMADTGLTVNLTDPGTGKNRLKDGPILGAAVCLPFWYERVLRAIMSSFSRSGTGSFSPHSSSSSLYSGSLWDVERTTVASGCRVSIWTLTSCCCCCCSVLQEKLSQMKYPSGEPHRACYCPPHTVRHTTTQLSPHLTFSLWLLSTCTCFLLRGAASTESTLCVLCLEAGGGRKWL